MQAAATGWDKHHHNCCESRKLNCSSTIIMGQHHGRPTQGAPRARDHVFAPPFPVPAGSRCRGVARVEHTWDRLAGDLRGGATSWTVVTKVRDLAHRCDHIHAAYLAGARACAACMWVASHPLHRYKPHTYVHACDPSHMQPRQAYAWAVSAYRSYLFFPACAAQPPPPCLQARSAAAGSRRAAKRATMNRLCQAS